MRPALWIAGAVVLGGAGCFQTIDRGAASGAQSAPTPVSADGGTGAPFPIMVGTPPITLPDGTTTTDPCVANAAWSKNILKNDCASCHQAPNDVGLPPWNFVLDDQKLTTTIDTRTNLLFVAPGDPDHSRIYQRIANNEMPPPPNSSVAVALPRPSVSDISVIRQWIICLGGGAKGSDDGAGGDDTEGTGGKAGSGGAPGTGGAAGAAATGGVSGTGGVMGTGGAAGAAARGGTTGTGGVAGAGGRGGTTGTGGVAGAGGRGGRTGTGGGTGGDPARYNFETSVQGWQSGTDSDEGGFTSVATSTALHFAGVSSLAGTIAATAATKYALEVEEPNPPPAPGTAVTFHVFVPTGALVDWVQPYVVDANSVFTGYYVMNPTQNMWNTITVTVPADAAVINRMGVQFHTSGAWSGTVNVDSVNW